MKPQLKNRPSSRHLFIGGHRSLTTLIVGLILFLSVAVLFVNAVVISEGNDDAYRSQAESNASLTKFDPTLLKKVEDFSARNNDTTVPAGRINPFNG